VALSEQNLALFLPHNNAAHSLFCLCSPTLTLSLSLSLSCSLNGSYKQLRHDGDRFSVFWHVTPCGLCNSYSVGICAQLKLSTSHSVFGEPKHHPCTRSPGAKLPDSRRLLYGWFTEMRSLHLDCLPLRQKQPVTLKLRYPSSKLQGVSFQNMQFFIHRAPWPLHGVLLTVSPSTAALSNVHPQWTKTTTTHKDTLYIL
jgi:hypothetical protein